MSPVINVDPAAMRAVKIPPKVQAIFTMYCCGIVLAMSKNNAQNMKAIVTQNGIKKEFSTNCAVRLETAAGPAVAVPVSRNKPISIPKLYSLRFIVLSSAEGVCDDTHCGSSDKCKR